MVDNAAPGLAPLGLGVGRCRIRREDPSVVDLVYYCDKQTASGDNQRREVSLRSSGAAVTFAGRFELQPSETDSGGATLEFEFAGFGASGFRISVSQGEAMIAQGKGLADPDTPGDVLVSWWVGETGPYGIVKYSMRDAETITGHYVSKMSRDQASEDRVVGDTSGGFRGRFLLTSHEPSGRTWGPHDWLLCPRGEIVDLTWVEKGYVFCRGFGLILPDDPSSMVVNYIPVKPHRWSGA